MEKTVISWTLNDYCRAQCEYCPTHVRGGLAPHETSEYLRVANQLISHYRDRLGRSIHWIINGGEPLDIDDIAMVLKVFKAGGESVTLHTNGGKLWIDWWAIEPYVDNLVLTFHFWQNPALIKYLIQTYTEKNKSIQITAPIRHRYVKEDLARVEALEKDTGFVIVKSLLYREGSVELGLYNYDTEDLRLIDISNGKLDEGGTSAVEQQEYYQETTWDDRYKDTYSSNPVYTGQMCNAGIERLYIGALGWVSGSACNNQPMGNVFNSFNPPDSPQKCGMIACVNNDDQLITKFPLGAL